MKQIKNFAMTIAGLWCCMAVSAHDFEVNGIYYIKISETEVCVTYRGTDYDQYNDEYVGKIEIPERVTYNDVSYTVISIGMDAFAGCTNLTSFSIPNSVTSIGDGAFYRCRNLTSVTIPNSVTSIGDDAFVGCTNLRRITIPNSVTYIGDEAFGSSPNLVQIIVEEGNPNYDSRENCNAIIETETNTLILGCSSTIIPNSVTSIGDDAFAGCTNLTSFSIPNSVTSIGDGAFWECTNLTNITIPNSVTSIGYEVFYGCFSLINVSIPNSVTSIEEGAFCECFSLTSITIPNSVTYIGSYVFEGCSSLINLTLASSEPPTAHEDSFDTNNFIYTTLYVPKGSLATYQAADVWKNFMKIEEYDPAGIEENVFDTESSNAPIYNLQGVQMKDVDNLPSGIYIQDGKKFVVK